MRIAIVGVGGVGGFFGAKLAQSPHEVIFIARGEHLEVIREQGLEIESAQGDFIVSPSLATDNPAEVGEVDVIILATKAWQVTQAAESMKPMVGANTMVIPLLNGVEAPIQLSNILGAEHVLGGFCRILSYRPEAGRIVVQGGLAPLVVFGEQDGKISKRVNELADVFDSAGVKVQIPNNILAEMWQKLLFIASFGGVGAITGQSAGIIRNMPETRTMIESAMEEVKAVAIARGISMAQDAVAQGMQTVDAMPAEGMASMQRDILNHQASELDAQNGAVVRLGKEVQIPTPIHQVIYHALLPSERIARGEL